LFGKFIIFWRMDKSKAPQNIIEWHEIFGLMLTDYFIGSRYKVDLEKDLSLTKQRLDVLIIEQEAGNEISEPPDGLENLRRHNLMTFKSIRQPLDGWALDELIGHHVNYRKQISASLEKLLPIEDFGLYAVCAHYPEKLATETTLEFVKQGVYEVKWGSRWIRIIVLSQVPPIERSAVWLLFSGIMEKVQFGALKYAWRRPDHSGIFNNLLQRYQAEGMTMPYTWDDYFKEHMPELLELAMRSASVDELLQEPPVQEFLQKLPPEERVKGLPPEERLKGLTREEIEAYLSKLSTLN